jgi:hypothetical protein
VNTALDVVVNVSIVASAGVVAYHVGVIAHSLWRMAHIRRDVKDWEEHVRHDRF